MARGSIRKRPRKNGTSYEIHVDIGYDPVTGERRQETATFHDPRSAEKEVTRLLTEVDQGTVVETTKMTIREYLPYWLEMHQHDLRPATLQQYRSLINAHLIPSLGNIQLQKLQPIHLVKMYGQKRMSGRRDGKGGLSPRSVRHLHVVIREALAFAVKMQMVSRNVADIAEAPRFSRKEMETWSAEEARRFLDATQGDTYSPIWLVALTTGLRRGELLGIRWRDLDLTVGRLNVMQTVTDIGGHVHIQEPKTASARRTVRLSPTCVAALKEHRIRQLEMRLQFDTAWRDHDLVFTTLSGKPVQPRVLSRAFEVLQRKAGVRRIRLHDLRHTHATLLFNAGMNIKMISQRLGHSDPSITLSTYTHLAHDAQDEAASSIDALIFTEGRSSHPSVSNP